MQSDNQPTFTRVVAIALLCPINLEVAVDNLNFCIHTQLFFVANKLAVQCKNIYPKATLRE